MVQQALAGSVEEYEVKMTFGELLLYHTLMQDCGLPFVGQDRFIPLMERSAARVRGVNEL